MTKEHMEQIRNQHEAWLAKDQASVSAGQRQDSTIIVELLSEIDRLEGANNDWKKVVALVNSELEDHKQSLEDKRRLTRELDHALFGDKAAEQASLCDLIGPAKKLRSELEEAKAKNGRMAEMLKLMAEISFCKGCQAYHKDLLERFDKMIDDAEREKK